VNRLIKIPHCFLDAFTDSCHETTLFYREPVSSNNSVFKTGLLKGKNACKLWFFLLQIVYYSYLKTATRHRNWSSGNYVSQLGYCYPPSQRKSGNRQTFLPSPQQNLGIGSIRPSPMKKDDFVHTLTSFYIVRAPKNTI